MHTKIGRAEAGCTDKINFVIVTARLRTDVSINIHEICLREFFPVPIKPVFDINPKTESFLRQKLSKHFPKNKETKTVSNKYQNDNKRIIFFTIFLHKKCCDAKCHFPDLVLFVSNLFS